MMKFFLLFTALTMSAWAQSSPSDYRTAAVGLFCMELHDPQSLNFGDVKIGESKTFTVTFQKWGDGACDVFCSRTKQEQLPFNGSLDFMRFVGIGGRYNSFDMTFSPTAVGTYVDTIVYYVVYTLGDGSRSQTTDAVLLVGNGIGPSGVVTTTPLQQYATVRITHTTISVATLDVSYLSQQPRVCLALYDMLGNVVERLVEDRMEPGEHRVRFGIGNFPSGLYRVQLETNGGATGQWISVVR
jgi:hypothetical protein